MKFRNKNVKEGGRWRGTCKSIGNIVILIAVFAFGLGVGQGDIKLGTSRFDSVNKDLPANLDYSSVEDIYDSLKANYDGKVTAAQLTEGLKHGLAEATNDPYTTYFTPAEAKEFESALNNSFSGIGAQLGQDKDGNIEVIAPIDGLPADKAGIRAKDVIASINGTTTSGLSIDEAVKKIRGPKGTTVKLQIVRDRKEALEFSIVRQDIVLPSVKTKTLDGNIGYIQITSYANDTVELVQKAAQQFKNDGVKGIVLDLRNNPGGLLEGSVKVSSLWLPAGKTVLQEKRGSTIVQSYESVGGNILSGIPTVVLINGGSASASEITAGALRDNNAAYLIGEKSYGKGVVQQLVNFKDGSQLKVTIASWYRPNGKNINKVGITPDKTVKISEEDAKAEKDTQLEAAQAYLAK